MVTSYNVSTDPADHEDADFDVDDLFKDLQRGFQSRVRSVGGFAKPDAKWHMLNAMPTHAKCQISNPKCTNIKC